MRGKSLKKNWIACGNIPRTKRPITPSPSMIRWVMLSLGFQVVYSSAMLITAMERIVLVSRPTIPIPPPREAALLS